MSSKQPTEVLVTIDSFKQNSPDIKSTLNIQKYGKLLLVDHNRKIRGL